MKLQIIGKKRTTEFVISKISDCAIFFAPFLAKNYVYTSESNKSGRLTKGENVLNWRIYD